MNRQVLDCASPLALSTHRAGPRAAEDCHLQDADAWIFAPSVQGPNALPNWRGASHEPSGSYACEGVGRFAKRTSPAGSPVFAALRRGRRRQLRFRVPMRARRAWLFMNIVSADVSMCLAARCARCFRTAIFSLVWPLRIPYQAFYEHPLPFPPPFPRKRDRVSDCAFSSPRSVTEQQTEHRRHRLWWARRISCQLEVSARGRARAIRRHWSCPRGSCLGWARVGVAERRGVSAQQRHRVRHRAAEGFFADPVLF